MPTSKKSVTSKAKTTKKIETAHVDDVAVEPVNPLVELTADKDVELVRRAIVKRFGGSINTEFIVALIAFVREMTAGEQQ